MTTQQLDDNNASYKKFNLKDFALKSMALSFIAGAILIATGVIADSTGSTITSIQVFIICYAIFFPISTALIVFVSNKFKKYNQGYALKTVIYSMYQILIAVLSEEIANVLFMDVMNKFIGFAIISIALFAATEITYYPIAYAIFMRNKKKSISDSLS